MMPNVGLPVNECRPDEAGGECSKCHAHLPPEAAYCLYCGSPVVTSPLLVIKKKPHTAAFRAFRTSAAVSAGLAVCCILAALLTGVVMNEQTVLDWQAVQAWRVEWLLGGVALFLLARFLQEASLD